MEFSTNLSVLGCTWDICLISSRVLSFHRHSDTVIYQYIPKHYTKTPTINMCGLSGILLPTFTGNTVLSSGFFVSFVPVQLSF